MPRPVGARYSIGPYRLSEGQSHPWKIECPVVDLSHLHAEVATINYRPNAVLFAHADQLLEELVECADMLAGAMPHAPRIHDLLQRRLGAARALIAKAADLSAPKADKPAAGAVAVHRAGLPLFTTTVTHQLSARQVEALEAAVAKGGAIYVPGSRAGGSISRMCNGLAARGLVEKHGPHAITAEGRAVLAALAAKKAGRKAAA